MYFNQKTYVFEIKNICFFLLVSELTVLNHNTTKVFRSIMLL